MTDSDMRRHRDGSRGWGASRLGTTLIMGALLTGALHPAGALAGPEKEQKSVRRQLTLLEKVIDATLVDSPNVRVWGNANTGGIYLPGYGILFTAGGSLMLENSVAEVAKKFGKGVKVYVDGEEEGEEEGGDESDPKTEARRAKRDAERQTKRLEGLKQEMIDVLADYGATLKLAPAEKVGIALFLMNESYSDAWNRVVLIEVSKADLDRYDNNQINEEEFGKRVKISEY